MSRRVKRKTSHVETTNNDVPEYNRDLYGHLRNKQVDTSTVAKTSASSTKALALVMGGIIVVSMGFAGVFQTNLFNGGTSNGNNNPIATSTNGVSTTPIEDLCVNHQQLGTHWHYQLIIIINGNTLPIDANIGITDTCMHAIHTHDTSGLFHLELPAGWAGTPRLGDLFKIWGAWAGEDLSLSSTTLMGQTGTVKLTSDDYAVTGNPANYILGPPLSNHNEVLKLTMTT